MGSIRISVITLLGFNLLLLGVQASQPVTDPAGTTLVHTQQKVEAPTIVLLKDLQGMHKTSSGQQCFTVGPFESAATVEAMVEMLGAYVSSAHARTTEAFVDRGYWVYLPPFESELSARRAIKTLYETGHNDLNLIVNGEWNLSVSLGYFVSQDNASKLVKDVREQGFEAEMRIQRDDESRYWVDYRQSAGQEYAWRVLADLVPETLHRALSCAAEEPAGPETPVAG